VITLTFFICIALPVNATDNRTLLGGGTGLYTFVVGLEGTGHRILLDLIPLLAKACDTKVHVLSGGEQSSMSTAGNVASFKNVAQQIGNQKKPNKYLILITQSFPFGLDKHFRPKNIKDAESKYRYNLKWIASAAMQAGLKTRFLFIDRDKEDTLDAHNFDNTFMDKVTVLSVMAQHIRNNFEATHGAHPDLWRHLDFEMLQYPEAHLKGVVMGLMNFLGLTGCNTDQAMKEVLKIRRDPSDHVISPDKKKSIQNVDLGAPIPTIELASTVPGVHDVYLRVIGFDGAGHDRAVRRIAAVASACGVHLVKKNDALMIAARDRDERGFERAVTSLRDRQDNACLVVDSRPLYEGEQAQAGALANDLEWVGRAAKTGGLQVRLLTLSRDAKDLFPDPIDEAQFASTLSTHTSIAESIREEYMKLSAKHPDIWRQISFESLNVTSSGLTRTVQGIIELMGWKSCDVPHAVSRISHMIPSPSVNTGLSANQQMELSKAKLSFDVPFIHD